MSDSLRRVPEDFYLFICLYMGSWQRMMWCVVTTSREQTNFCLIFSSADNDNNTNSNNNNINSIHSIVIIIIAGGVLGESR